MNLSTNINDENFWKQYYEYPLDELMENLDNILQEQEQAENELQMQMQMQIDTTETLIEEYLNQNLFPTTTTIPTTPDIITEKTCDIMEHALPQFIFAIDNIPPFYFLLKHEETRIF